MKGADAMRVAIAGAVFGAVALVLAGSFALVTLMEPNVDETFHYPQITSFLQGDFRLSPSNSMLPGYHYFVYAIAWLVGAKSINAIRLISFCIAVMSLFVFYVLARKIRAGDALGKTLQYMAFPLLYPFFFVVYTDVFSILLVCLALYLTLERRYRLAGAVGILSCLVRQDNIAWVGFMFLLLVVDALRTRDGNLVVRGQGYSGGAAAAARAIASEGAVHLVAFALFAIFVLINKGVAVDHEDWLRHSNIVHLGNAYLLLFSFFFLFLPLNLANAPKIVALVRRHRLAPIYGLALFALYLGTFTIDHPYNTETWAQWFLSNRILANFQQDLVHKVLFFLPILYSILSLAVTPLCDRKYYLIYPVSALFLAPHWQVDPRYHLIPLVLFLAFKEESAPWVRYGTYLLYIGLSAYFLLSITAYDFFF